MSRTLYWDFLHATSFCPYRRLGLGAAGRGAGSGAQAPSPGPFRPGAVAASSEGTVSPASVTLSLPDAIARARMYTQQVYSAEIAAKVAHEDSVQAKAALLPTVTCSTSSSTRSPTARLPGIFVSNDGPHVYNNQAVVHGGSVRSREARRLPKGPGERGRGAGPERRSRLAA